MGCKTVDDIKAVDPNYLTNDIIDGVWSEDLGDLEDGENMFKDYKNLATFTSDLSSLTRGRYMFNGCYKLTSFSVNLPNLENGIYMFYNTGLSSFSSDLSSLVYGTKMFYNTSLTSFSVNLPSLTGGTHMFDSCSHLKSFSSDLSSLSNGEFMFQDCGKLTSFSSQLSSLINGAFMFYWCRLDAPSVANIIRFIPQRDAKPTSTTNYGNIHIGIDTIDTDEAKQAFAEKGGYKDWAELNKGFDDKNWSVHWQFTGIAS
jgi:glutaredoxin-related protein